MSPELLLHAPVTLTLLGINIVLSIMAFNSVRLIDSLMLHIGPVMNRGELHRTVTSGFIHADPGHLLMNMITLFFFGPILEIELGTQTFLLIYFASLLAGSGWAIMENFRNPNYRALGASGAISGVTVAYAMIHPFSMMLVFFIPMPAIIFAVVYILFSAFASSGKLKDNIGHGAHLGGALMGLVLICILYPLEIRELVDQLLNLLP